MGELFASDVKGIAGSLSGTLNWLLGKAHNFSQLRMIKYIF